MTNSQPSRLDQIEDKLDRITNILQTVTETALKNEENISELSNTVDVLIQVQRTQQETTTSILNSIAVMQSEVRQMQSDVKGLQTENRRILDRLLGEETDENNN